MSYSGTRNFQNTEIVKLIEDAYRCVGKLPAFLTVPDDIISATFSLNLILSSWANEGVNLWAVSRNNLLPLIPNKTEYALPKDIVDILEVSTRTSNRLLGGTAFSSQGDAENAFDGNPDTACIQTNPDGYIGYNFGDGITNMVQMFGLQSNVNRAYTLSIQYSLDDTNWIDFLEIPETQFISGETQWFNINNPKQYQYFRILETGGAVLNVREVYFEGNITDTVVSPESRSNYMSYPSKYTTGRPSVYIFNRELPQSLTLWPAPISYYPLIIYNCTLQIQDIGSLTNTSAIPPAFYMALRDGLAYELSLKWKPELSGMRKEIYDASLSRATRENTEKYVPIAFSLGMSKYT